MLVQDNCIKCAIKEKERDSYVWISPNIFFLRLGASFTIDIKESLLKDNSQMIIKIKDSTSLVNESSIKQVRINQNDVFLSDGQGNICHYLKPGKNNIQIAAQEKDKICIIYAVNPKQMVPERYNYSIKESLEFAIALMTKSNQDFLTVSLINQKTQNYFKVPARGPNCTHYSVFENSKLLSQCPLCGISLSNTLVDELLASIIDYANNDFRLKNISEAKITISGHIMVGEITFAVLGNILKEVEGKKIIVFDYIGKQL